MKRLTKKEEVIMDYFWKEGAMTVGQIREFYAEPKPHVNTISTQIRTLEANGYLGHEKKSMGYVYFPIVTQADYSNVSIGKLVSQCFENSYIDAVSALVKDERISIDELKDLINRIEQKD